VDDFLFARSQMAVSLAFHIIFAVVGMGMPALMAISEGLYLRTGNPVYLDLSKRWARGTAILFAVGAVSGTVLSFELGLLWPTFMEHAGPLIGLPFSLEGFAFFTEAIFLGVYLYGWDRVPPFLHWVSGVIVAASGIFSGIFVVMANAWMNAPVGFELINGKMTHIDPIRAMLSPAAFHQTLHMTLAAYVATGFLVAGIHAFFLLRDRQNMFHRKAFGIALLIGSIAIPLQLISGDISARMVGKLQPAKLAAMEAHYHTGSRAPLVVGGWPDDEKMETRFGLEIPSGLSLLIGHSPDTVVAGLDQIPRENWPNVRLVHWSFDIMVGCGMAMMLMAIWAGWIRWRTGALPDYVWFLRGMVVAAPLGFIAIETGWMVTELGRQPWIIYGVMKTRDAVTPMPGLGVTFAVFTAIYLVLSVVLVFLLRRQFVQTREDH